MAGCQQADLLKVLGQLQRRLARAGRDVHRQPSLLFVGQRLQQQVVYLRAVSRPVGTVAGGLLSEQLGHLDLGWRSQGYSSGGSSAAGSSGSSGAGANPT